MRTTMMGCAAALLLAATTPLWAQPAPKPAQAPPPTQRYDFDDDRVDGELVQPDEAAVDGRSRARHESLIRLRSDFVPELMGSADEL